MRKFLCSLVLFAAVGMLVATAPAPARSVAARDDEKKDEKKDADKKAAGLGTVVVYAAKDGWRFRVTDAEGKSIAIGLQGYAKKADCLATVALLKATMAKVEVTEIVKDAKK